ncbi:hypothetical protein C8Q80DRAFT_405673 [Daedaleopsis nitida]|nr:hypothetical protein C8Q80DRAFT_405673 [Daedaleopsis nitida]
MAPAERLSRPHTFDDVAQTLHDFLKASPAVRHVPRIKLRQVAFDIAIVASGVRSGYLFDAFVLRDKRLSLKDFFSELLTLLRKSTAPLQDVVMLSDESSEQLFIISLPMVKGYYDPDIGGLSNSLSIWTSFIELQQSSAKISTPPPALASMLRAIVSDAGAQDPPVTALSLAEHEPRTIGDMVAFAACVLEFPVAYVPLVNPNGGAGAFLAGVALDVYECLLVPSEREDRSSVGDADHAMLKFSCPQTLGGDVPVLRPERVVERLVSRFGERVRAATSSYEVAVMHSVETMDRVAM